MNILYFIGVTYGAAALLGGVGYVLYMAFGQWKRGDKSVNPMAGWSRLR